MAGQVVVVTGGSRGIGRAVTEEFVKNGDIVYSISRTPSDVAGVQLIEADVRDMNTIKQALQGVFKEHGQIDVLVNNAGIMEDALIGMISHEKMVEQFQINVFAVIELTQLAARFMKRKKSGSIINVASIIGTNGNAGQSVYSATKGAVISFTKSAAKELAKDGIRVNAVAPGIIETTLVEHVPQELMEKRVANIGLGRMGQPEEVAKAIAFLGSKEASYVSGQILGIDGCAVI